MGADKSTWQFPANEPGKVIGWGPTPRSGMVNIDIDAAISDKALIKGNNLSDVDNATLAAGNLNLIERDTVALLLADTIMDYSIGAGKTAVATGQIVKAGGFRYKIASSGASDHHLTTAGGVKLYAFGPHIQLAQLGAVNDGVTACDDALDLLLSISAATGQEVAVHGKNYLLTEEHAIPEGAKLVAPYGPMLHGSGFVVTDDTLRSALYVGADDVNIEGVHVEMPQTFQSGMTGVGIFINACSGARLRKTSTKYGKFGHVVFDSDDIRLIGCETTLTARYGFLLSGGRDVLHDDCKVFGTTDTTANDCFKCCGLVTGYGTRSSYDVFYKNCHGEGSAAGQVIDIIMDNDAANDIYNIFVENLTGRDCAYGFIELKTGDTLSTNWIHSVYINGGHYKGSNGTDEDGMHIARRTDNCHIRGVTVTDVRTGLACGNPGRRMVIEDFTAIRPRQNGIECAWTGNLNKLIRPTIIDPNYGQASSLYAGIKLSSIGDIEINDPMVVSSDSSPAAFKHTYGIEFGSTNGRINVTGSPTLFGHVTAPFSWSSGNVQWPVTYNLGSWDLAASDSASSEIRASHENRFQACAVSYTYQTASNVSRTVTTQARGATNTTVLAQASSASAVIAQRDLYQLASPVAISRSFPAWQVTLSAVTRPGSPTGKIIVELHGYIDGGVMN